MRNRLKDHYDQKAKVSSDEAARKRLADSNGLIEKQRKDIATLSDKLAASEGRYLDTLDVLSDAVELIEFLLKEKLVEPYLANKARDVRLKIDELKRNHE